MLSSSFYSNNRKRLVDTMVDHSFYYCHSGSEIESTDDETYLFEPYRNFVYLTGVDKPECILLILKNNNEVQEFLFMHIPTPMEQRWIGASFDMKQVQESTGIQRIVDIREFDNMMSRFLFSGVIQDVYMDMARYKKDYDPNKEQRIANSFKEVYPYLTFHNAYPTVCKMRRVKSEEEIEAHRVACNITEEGVKLMLDHMKPGMKECQIEAYYDFVLKSYNVKKPAFSTIAATGKNACVMHYVENDTVCEENSLILFDLGAKWDYYCADVSRTYPVSGKFTERQKQLYNVVLKGLEVAESLSKPGQKKNELQQISKQVMAEELVKIGNIENVEEIDKYYFHGSGHYIGLNTHDVGDERDVVLEENTMFTLEPGLYFDDEKIGIRIDDTLLVTKEGCEILSGGIPKTVEEIETYMAEHNKNVHQGDL